MSELIDRTSPADGVLDEPAARPGGGDGDRGDGGDRRGGGGGDGHGDGANPDRTDGGRFPIAAVAAGVVAVVVAVMFFVLAGADPRTDDEASSPLVGKPAPEVQAELIDGGVFDLARRRGSWVVLNFFQSTCVPCMREHPQLVELAEQQRALGTDGAELYTIASPPDDDDAVRTFFDTYGGGDWPIVRDYQGTIGVKFGVSKYPETWIIDDHGVVRQRLISEIAADGVSSLIRQLQELDAG